MLLASTADRKLLAVAYDGGAVEVWDPLEAARKDTLGLMTAKDRHQSKALAISADGQHVAVGFQNGEIRLADRSANRNGALIQGNRAGCQCLTFTPDGRTLASGSSFVCQFWDVATGQFRAALAAPADTPALAFGPNGQVLATAHSGGRRLIKLWDANGILEPVVHHSAGPPPARAYGGVRALRFENGDEGVAAVVESRKVGQFRPLTIEHWRIDGKERRDTPTPIGWHYFLALRPDGLAIAGLSGDEKKTLLISATSGQTLVDSPPIGKFLAKAAWSHDGKLLATAGKTLTLWDAATLQRTGEFARPTDGAGGGGVLVFAPDDNTLASCGRDGVLLWDVASKRRRLLLKGEYGDVNCLAFSADGKLVAAGGKTSKWGKGGLVNIWDTTTGAHVATLKGHTRGVLGVAFSPDGRTLATAAGDWILDPATQRFGEVSLWDPSTGQERVRFKTYPASAQAIAFDTKGKSLAVGYADGSVKVWRAGKAP